MREANFNSFLVRGLARQYGFAYKPSDPRGGVGLKVPHDIYGVMENRPLYLEAKLLKPDSGFKAFNFSILETHQMGSLSYLKSAIPDSLALVAVGFFVPRKLKGFFLFDILLILRLIHAEGKLSILAKELSELREGYFLPMADGVFDSSRIITEEVWTRVFA